MDWDLRHGWAGAQKGKREHKDVHRCAEASCNHCVRARCCRHVPVVAAERMRRRAMEGMGMRMYTGELLALLLHGDEHPLVETLHRVLLAALLCSEKGANERRTERQPRATARVAPAALHRSGGVGWGRTLGHHRGRRSLDDTRDDAEGGRAGAQPSW